KIHAAGRHLLALINDILDLSKIEAGRMELFLETFDVRTMAREEVTTIQPLVERNGNRLEVSLEDEGTMRADLTKVRQCLFNLLSNAAKFTERGTITLTVTRAGNGAMEQRSSGESPSPLPRCSVAPLPPGSPAPEWLVFQVSDTGIGMSEEQQAK